MVEHKIANVKDVICVGCPQNWANVCRAYSMPESNEEYKSRTVHIAEGKPGMKCFPNIRSR